MSGRLAVDFGTSNTVVAVWDAGRGTAEPLCLPDYGQAGGAPGAAPVWLVPSLIHYESEQVRWLGRQVLERELLDAPATFRWMKRYIAHRSPLKRRLLGTEIGPGQAGAEFLAAVLATARESAGAVDEEVALTVPVEAYEHFQEWLGQVAAQVGLPRYRLLDEASAAALGYGAAGPAGAVLLVFDFGGGTLDVSVVRREPADERSGPRCRVLGKAGCDLGGSRLDAWLYQWVLAECGHSEGEEPVRRLSGALLAACERAKSELSFKESTVIAAGDPDHGLALRAELSRGRFEALLDEHEAPALIDQTIRRALNAARDRGYDADDLHAVLMVGGGSHIPCVQTLLTRIFGRERVRCERPFDAVACGAAAYAAGAELDDHIQHDYAIRHLVSRSGHGYHPLVRRGTPYPTGEPVARLTIKATYDGQRQLGLAIFELGEAGRRRGSAVELVWDTAGAARLTTLSPDEQEQHDRFWINEQQPTFLTVDPPGTKGEALFEVTFGIDANKRLLLTARELRDGRLVLRDQPVVQLT